MARQHLGGWALGGMGTRPTAVLYGYYKRWMESEGMDGDGVTLCEERFHRVAMKRYEYGDALGISLGGRGLGSAASTH